MNTDVPLKLPAIRNLSVSARAPSYKRCKIGSGRLWTLQYDAQNYMTTMTTPLGCQTVYSYGLAGSPTTVVQAITDPRGFTTSYQYDSNQRVTTMSAGTAIWSYAYNVGNLPNVVMVSPSGAVTTSNYDGQGNLSSIQRPEGYTSTFAYDQTSYLKISETVPAGIISSISYDQNLWLPLVSVDGLGKRTTMLYDQFGNLTTYTDANGATTTYGYSGTGSTHLRIRQTDPLGRVTSYAYTSDGLLQSTTTPRGLTTTFNYDTYGECRLDYGERRLDFNVRLRFAQSADQFHRPAQSDDDICL